MYGQHNLEQLQYRVRKTSDVLQELIVTLITLVKTLTGLYQGVDIAIKRLTLRNFCET